MIFWSIVPEDVVFNGWEDKLELQEISYMDKTLSVRSGMKGSASVERILSTDPKDFLRKEFNPGNKIPFLS